MNKKLYLITGATGHLGNVLVSELLKSNANIKALVLPNEEKYLPAGVDYTIGDVRDMDSLIDFFNVDYDDITLIHSAAKITIASKEDKSLLDINVKGTDNIMKLALQNKINRVIYISSVHAITEKPNNEIITEISSFNPDEVSGQYAKSKAIAGNLVLEYAKSGLPVSIVHPSGIIGPGDRFNHNHMIKTMRAVAKGYIPVAIEGGYDFVDSRDVVKGILQCEKDGKIGECYILSGHYITIKELIKITNLFTNRINLDIQFPSKFIKKVAPLIETISLKFSKATPIITPYSIETLNTNGHFSHQKATDTFGYQTRDIIESIHDTLKEMEVI